MYTHAHAQLLRDSVRPNFAKLWMNLRGTLDTLEPSSYLFINTFSEQLFDKCIFEFGALEDLTLRLFVRLRRDLPQVHAALTHFVPDFAARQMSPPDKKNFSFSIRASTRCSSYPCRPVRPVQQIQVAPQLSPESHYKIAVLFLSLKVLLLVNVSQTGPSSFLMT